MNLLQQLRKWRGEQARLEGVEMFRVLPNSTLDEIAQSLPKTKEELLCVKGIKEAKFRKYGRMILEMTRDYVSNENGDSTSVIGNQELVTGKGSKGGLVTDYELPVMESVSDDPLSVSQFLDALNLGLSGMAARIKGEVSSVDIRERVIYFSIKDSQDESLISCLIFRYQYEVSGVKIEVGDEIIVEGVPEIYKPNGRLSLKVGIIELAGEGMLKKAYDELKKKLETEGLLAPEKKRILPEFPERIALITSEQGAAIGDFSMNLGAQGFKVTLFPSSVEGKRAVFEIIDAVKYFNRHADQYDILVIIRGGGSFESLQAFNNEALVREVANSQIPTLLGVGHEKDITLAALAADVMVSTPTATARTLREGWDRARQSVRHSEQALLERFSLFLFQEKTTLAEYAYSFSKNLDVILFRFRESEERFRNVIGIFSLRIDRMRERFTEGNKVLLDGFKNIENQAKRELEKWGKNLEHYDPKRALNLGYSLVRSSGMLIRSVKQTKKGDTIEIQVSDGVIGTEVKNII